MNMILPFYNLEGAIRTLGKAGLRPYGYASHGRYGVMDASVETLDTLSAPPIVPKKGKMNGSPVIGHLFFRGLGKVSAVFDENQDVESLDGLRQRLITEHGKYVERYAASVVQ